MITKQSLSAVASETCKALLETRLKTKRAMADLLIPFGEKGIKLNEHCEGCWMPSIEVLPNVHKVITAMRFTESLQVEIDGNWKEMRYPNDLQFLFSELVDAIECELELD